MYSYLPFSALPAICILISQPMPLLFPPPPCPQVPDTGPEMLCHMQMQMDKTLNLPWGSWWLKWGKGNMVKVRVSGWRGDIQGGQEGWGTHFCRRVIWFTSLRCTCWGERPPQAQQATGQGWGARSRGKMVSGRKPRVSDFARASPGPAPHETWTDLGGHGVFDFRFPHLFNRKGKRNFKKVQNTMTEPISLGLHCDLISEWLWDRHL